MTTFYLVRHGRSVGNAAEQVQGWLDLPLDERGRQEAVLLGERLRSNPLAAVYASPLARAVETARPLTEACGLPLILDERLREYHMGAWTGLTIPEIEAMMPSHWLEGGDDHIGPGAETGAAMRERVSSFIQDILTRHPEDAVVVISHGGTLGAMLSLVLGTPAIRRQPFTFGNASISEVTYERKRWRVRSLNDLCHLSPLRNM
jgi:broad specificity phosphatase PhoE